MSEHVNYERSTSLFAGEIAGQSEVVKKRTQQALLLVIDSHAIESVSF